MRHEGPFFSFKSEKKTDEGHLKQMREVPENLFIYFFGLTNTLASARVLIYRIICMQCYAFFVTSNFTLVLYFP